MSAVPLRILGKSLPPYRAIALPHVAGGFKEGDTLHLQREPGTVYMLKLPPVSPPIFLSLDFVLQLIFIVSLIGF